MKTSKYVWAQRFTRTNHQLTPALTETVWVIFEFKDPTITNENINDYEEKAWEELYKQYPLWNCPYNQSNQPPNKLEELRYSFSSPFIEACHRLN